MIGCYLDESIDPSRKGVFAVGGLLGRGRAFFELERRWKILRESPDIGIEYFKASECERARKQFGSFVKHPNNPELVTVEERAALDGIWSRFINVILGDSHEHVIIFGIGVLQEDFYRITNSDPKAKEILGDSPFWFAYQSAMIQATFATRKIGGGDAVAFVCDEDEEHSREAQDVYREMLKKNPESAKHMGTYTTGNDRSLDALQAADAAVYEVRRVLNTRLGQWKGSTRWQFNTLDDKHRVWLIQYANEKYLREVVRVNTPGVPLNLDQIMEEEYDKNGAFGL